MRDPQVTPSHRAGLHRRQLGAFVCEPVLFGKWFEVALDALECAVKLKRAWKPESAAPRSGFA
jgi:hypothetical protein